MKSRDKSVPITRRKEIEKDRIANLYRAALYLAKGYPKTALEFLKKSGNKIKIGKLNTKDQQLFWAEKILDQFNLLKWKNY